MQLRGRRLKFTVMAVVVVLALTGFSKSRHGHGVSKSHSSGGGGGCSSSSQDHDSSSSLTSGGSSSGGSGGSSGSSSSGSSGSSSTRSLQDAKTSLISCATAKTPYATVTVTNPNRTAGTFAFDVSFLDEQGDTVKLKSMQAYVSANNSTRVRVEVDDAGLLADIDHCDVDLYATPVR